MTEQADVRSPARVYSQLIHRWSLAEPEIRLLPVLCPRGSLAIDVGAHNGLYTWHLLQQTDNVVAFEPLPAMHELLQRFYGNRASLQTIALSDRSGQCQLRFPASNHGLATIAAGNRLEPEGQEIHSIVTCTAPLDSFGFENIGFVKIDVEGHEDAVLRGARASLTRDMPNLLVEIEERHAPGATAAVPEFLRNLGYAGCYFDAADIVDLANFRCDVDQPPKNVAGGIKLGRYINNFIFFRRDRAEEMRCRLRRAIAG